MSFPISPVVSQSTVRESLCFVMFRCCKVERTLAEAEAPAGFQFLRTGYFCVDSRDSAPGRPVFNRSVALKESFKKSE